MMADMMAPKSFIVFFIMAVILKFFPINAEIVFGKIHDVPFRIGGAAKCLASNG